MSITEYLKLIFKVFTKPSYFKAALVINEAMSKGSAEAYYDIKFTDTLFKRVSYNVISSEFKKYEQ